MTLASMAQHKADADALAAYEAASVNPYAIAEAVLDDGGDEYDASESAYDAMLDATGNMDAADRAAMNARGYAEELIGDG